MDSVDNTNFVNKSLTLLRTRLMAWLLWSQFFELAANRRIEMRWENRVWCLEWELWYYFQFSSWLFWLRATICSEFWAKLSKLYCPSDFALLVDCRYLFLHRLAVLFFTPCCDLAGMLKSFGSSVTLCGYAKPSSFGWFYLPICQFWGFWEGVPEEQQTRVLWMWPSKKTQLPNQVTVYKADLCQI